MAAELRRGIVPTVTFKEEFSALEQKSLNQIVATKIHKELSELRARVDASPTIPKRWVWELIQNAKDVNIGGKVCVRIEADLDGSDAHVTVNHNGGAFSAENIRFLIEQVSSKSRTKDSTGRPTTTGKFGTGFLTTHLLSPYVLVTGVAKQQGLLPRKFELYLDRSGTELDEIIAAVEAAKTSIQDLDKEPHYKGYVAGNFNTAFRYDLTDDTGKNVARAGLADLDICLPYTFAFVEELESVEYPDHLVTLQEREEEMVDGEVQFLSVTAADPEDGADPKTSTIAVLSKGLTMIAMPIEKTDEGVRLLPLDPDLPRLFCDFPLLGTELFPFPVVINNPTFNPTDARDGLFLTHTQRADPASDHNRTVMKEALALYFSLLKHASENTWRNLHLLAVAKPIPAGLGWVDQNWYRNEILKPIRDSLLRTNIVRTAAGTMAPIQSADGKKYAWFPSGPTKEVRRGIWRCCRAWFPERLPALPDVELWQDILWPDCGKLTLDQVAELTEAVGSIEILTAKLKGNAYAWLNDFYATLKLHEPDYLAVVAKRRIFPNQNGTFRKRAELSVDAGNIDPALLDILQLLGTDLRDELLAPEVVTDVDSLTTKDEAFVVKEISAAIDEHTQDRTAAKHYRAAFDRLLRWFREKPARAKALFPSLYRNKHHLYDDDEIVDNIERAEQLNELLKHYNVKTVAELHTVIEKQTGGSKLLPVTEEIIASLGITSVEEWKKALEDNNLAALFSHASTPTTDMFVYAQTLIQQAKDSVIAHLSTLPEYDVSAIDETAVTILAGVKHDGRDVQIVVRPAYDGTVIIYYQSEKDVLDYEDHELWVDTGKDVRRITFGHILKTTAIRRFPI
jgi:hypothetical protein